MGLSVALVERAHIFTHSLTNARTQAVGWTLFSLTSCYVFILSKALVTGMVHTLRSYLLGGSVLMMTTQTVGEGLVCF